jgi:hypothetical protein
MSDRILLVEDDPKIVAHFKFPLDFRVDLLTRCYPCKIGL